nr:uncharacterized protein LOC6625560 [Drosophila virilis]
MTNAICESRNRSWVTIEQCRLRAISRNKTVLNIEVTFLQPAYKIHVNIQMKKKANGYKPWLANYTIDGCAFMRRVNHPGVKILWEMIKDCSTVNHTCPYVGKQAVRDMWADLRNLKLPVPSGEYLILITWMLDMKPQFVTNVYFTLSQDMFKD